MTQSYCIKLWEIKSRTLSPSLFLSPPSFSSPLNISRTQCQTQFRKAQLAKQNESRWLRGLGWRILSAPAGASEGPWDLTPGTEASRLGTDEVTLGPGCVDTAPHLSGTSEQRGGGCSSPPPDTLFPLCCNVSSNFLFLLMKCKVPAGQREHRKALRCILIPSSEPRSW